MPLPSPSASRFFHRWRAQADPRDVAAELALPPRTVQRLFARFALHGEAAIAPDYHHCGQSQPSLTPADLVEQFCQTRRAHPRWGSEMIRLEIQGDDDSADVDEPDDSLPCARTIRRHLRKAGLAPAPPGRPCSPRPFVPRAQSPHLGWQIDAAEGLRLQGGQWACWLRVVDECSGAFLKTVVFACARWENVDRYQIQRAMQAVFAAWGLPGRARVDNGYPWGSSGDFPPETALWLIGLGVDMVWIPPACPQHNGVVERSQGTGKGWVEPQTCATAEQLQRRCDEMDRRQRERYPYRGGRSRMEVYPQLRHSGRKYSVAQERKLWDVSRALAAVERHTVRRKVDCTGSVSVYNRGRYVGKPHIGKQVYVSLDPTGPTWVIADEAGNQLRTHSADELSAERIRGLRVTSRKSRDL